MPALLAVALLAAGCSDSGPTNNPNVVANATYEVTFQPELK
jgi:hypothetical protein